jgi:hypothetical protein
MVTTIIQSLTEAQIWFSLSFISFVILGVIIFILKISIERGLPNPFKDGSYIIPPNSIKSNSLFEQKIWKKDILQDKKKIGEIAFLKEVVVFKLIGRFWDSATPEGIEGYNTFEEEWSPPDFLTDEQKRETECFLFIEKCNTDSTLVKLIKTHSIRWKRVFLVCSKSQYLKGAFDLIDSNRDGINLNITIIPVSTNI